LQDMLVLKHSILMQQIETKYMEHLNTLLTQKTKLMVALQSAYYKQRAELETQCGPESGGEIEDGLRDVLCGVGGDGNDAISNGMALPNLDLEHLISGELATATATAPSSSAVLGSILSNLSGQSTASSGCPQSDGNGSSEESLLSMLSTRSSNERHAADTKAMPEIDVEALHRLVLPNIDELIPPEPATPNGAEPAEHRETAQIARSPKDLRKSLGKTEGSPPRSMATANRKRSRAVMEDEVSSGDSDSDREKKRKSSEQRKGRRKRAKSRHRAPRESERATTTDGVAACCVCRRPPAGQMIECHNALCKVGSFHLSCMRLFKGRPTLKWYCKDCRRYPSKSSIGKPEFDKHDRR